MTTKIILADDHALVRAGIRALIDQLPGFSVSGEASGMTEALRLMDQDPAAILITDISMGLENGLELARRCKARYPDTAVIILSMHAEGDIVSEALQAGASSYLLKEAAPAELELALRAVAKNEIFLSPAVSTRMVQRYIHPPAREVRDGRDALSSLTPRQLQILTLIAQRKSTKEIAWELDLSEKTIAAHRSQLMDRLGVRDVVGLALLAVKHRLVQAPH